MTPERAKRARRVLLVIDNLGWGGAQRQIVNLAASLGARGHETTLFVYQPQDHFADEARAAGAILLRSAKRFALDPTPLLALRRAAATGPDAIVSFMPTPTTYAVVASALAGRVPVIASERGADERRAANLTRQLRRQPLRLAAHVTTNSHHQAARLLATFPWMADRLTVVWNGIDTSKFRPVARAPSESFRLLAVGSVKPIKQVELLAAALVASARRGARRVCVRWVGAIVDEGVRARVDELLAANGLADRWTWLGLRDDVAACLQACDALVHPNADEGLPNAICEALASGVAVVAARAADHARLLGEGERGALFEPRDAASLADAIDRMAALDAPALDAMGRRARAFADEELSLDAYGASYEALIERVARR